MAERRCHVHLGHHPAPQNVARHHIVPTSWDGPDEVSNLIDICPTGHENVHTLLNHYVREGGTPPWRVRFRFSVVERRLAAIAWSNRPKDRRPPYTTGAG